MANENGLPDGMKRTVINREVHCYAGGGGQFVLEVRRDGGKPALSPSFKVAALLSKRDALRLAAELLEYGKSIKTDVRVVTLREDGGRADSADRVDSAAVRCFECQTTDDGGWIKYDGKVFCYECWNVFEPELGQR